MSGAYASALFHNTRTITVTSRQSPVSVISRQTRLETDDWD